MNVIQFVRYKFRWKGLESDPRDLEEKKILFNDPHEYSRVDDESFYKDISDQERCRTKGYLSYRLWFTVFNLFLFCATVLINVKLLHQRWTNETDACVRATSSYSPFLESKSTKFHHEKINGTIWPSKNPSWSRKEIHDPDAEAMWTFFNDVHQFPITRAEALALGKDPDTLSKFPNEIFGLGEEAYIASLDVQHKLHCLDELRKMAFATYGPNPSTKKQHGQLWWHHLRHCLDIVTEDMMCHADADVVTYRWVDTEPLPFPDFSVNRKCRSFDDLIRWRDERRVDMKLMRDLNKPSGVTQIPHEPGYYAAYGFYYSDLYPNGEGYTEELPNVDDWFGLPPTPDQGFEEPS